MNAIGIEQGDSRSATLPRVGQGSLTERTTQALLEAILDRRFPNDRLPNEPDLADQMGVSRTTIRSALQTLDRLGVISRAPGRGTQLRPHIGRESMLLHRVIGIRGMLEGRYDKVSIEQAFTIESGPSDIAGEALGLTSTTEVLVNDKVYLVDGVPAVHLLQEIPLSLVDRAEADGLVSGAIAAPPTIFDLSRTWHGGDIDHSVIELVPRVAGVDGPVTGGLRIADGTPYIELRETHYSEHNVPIAFNRSIVDDSFTRFRMVRTR